MSNQAPCLENDVTLKMVVLLEAPFDPLRRQMNSVLLTVDLTRAVADEAIERKDSIVIAYREFLFLRLTISRILTKFFFSEKTRLSLRG